jgi:hypothetical protein
MARLRRESASTSKPAFFKKSSKTKPTDVVLHKHVFALGGTQDDIDLLKNVDENATGGPSKLDVCVTA